MGAICQHLYQSDIKMMAQWYQFVPTFSHPIPPTLSDPPLHPPLFIYFIPYYVSFPFHPFPPVTFNLLSFRPVIYSHLPVTFLPPFIPNLWVVNHLSHLLLLLPVVYFHPPTGLFSHSFNLPVSCCLSLSTILLSSCSLQPISSYPICYSLDHNFPTCTVCGYGFCVHCSLHIKESVVFFTRYPTHV